MLHVHFVSSSPVLFSDQTCAFSALYSNSVETHNVTRKGPWTNAKPEYSNDVTSSVFIIFHSTMCSNIIQQGGWEMMDDG